MEYTLGFLSGVSITAMAVWFTMLWAKMQASKDNEKLRQEQKEFQDKMLAQYNRVAYAAEHIAELMFQRKE